MEALIIKIKEDLYSWISRIGKLIRIEQKCKMVTSTLILNYLKNLSFYSSSSQGILNFNYKCADGISYLSIKDINQHQSFYIVLYQKRSNFDPFTLYFYCGCSSSYYIKNTLVNKLSNNGEYYSIPAYLAVYHFNSIQHLQLNWNMSSDVKRLLSMNSFESFEALKTYARLDQDDYDN